MDLDQISAITEQRERGDKYREAIEKAVAARDTAACKRFVDHGAWGGWVGTGMTHEGGRLGLHSACTPAADRRRRLPTAPPLPPPCPHSAVLSDAVPLALSRTTLLVFAQSLPQLPADLQQEVAT